MNNQNEQPVEGIVMDEKDQLIETLLQQIVDERETSRKRITLGTVGGLLIGGLAVALISNATRSSESDDDDELFQIEKEY